MNASLDVGLFLPYTRRTAAKTKKQIVDKFLETGKHNSPSGLTARIVAHYCIENRVPFRVDYRTDPFNHYRGEKL